MKANLPKQHVKLKISFFLSLKVYLQSNYWECCFDWRKKGIKCLQDEGFWLENSFLGHTVYQGLVNNDQYER